MVQLFIKDLICKDYFDFLNGTSLTLWEIVSFYTTTTDIAVGVHKWSCKDLCSKQLLRMANKELKITLFCREAMQKGGEKKKKLNLTKYIKEKKLWC